MGVDSEVELLKRQNRRLKVALSIVTTLLLLLLMAAVGLAVLARYEAERARVAEQRALQTAEDTQREQAESQNDAGP